jgi:hypothetical protein
MVSLMMSSLEAWVFTKERVEKATDGQTRVGDGTVAVPSFPAVASTSSPAQASSAPVAAASVAVTPAALTRAILPVPFGVGASELAAPIISGTLHQGQPSPLTSTNPEGETPATITATVPPQFARDVHKLVDDPLCIDNPSMVYGLLVHGATWTFHAMSREVVGQERCFVSRFGWVSRGPEAGRLISTFPSPSTRRHAFSQSGNLAPSNNQYCVQVKSLDVSTPEGYYEALVTLAGIINIGMAYRNMIQDLMSLVAKDQHIQDSLRRFDLPGRPDPGTSNGLAAGGGPGGEGPVSEGGGRGARPKRTLDGDDQQVAFEFDNNADAEWDPSERILHWWLPATTSIHKPGDAPPVE